MTTEVKDVADKLRKLGEWLDFDIGRDDPPAGELPREAASLLESLSSQVAIADRNRDAARKNFHTMQQSAAALASRATAAEGRVALLEEALGDARQTMRNAAGAIQSGQVHDKDVDRQLRRGYEAIDARLAKGGQS